MWHELDDLMTETIVNALQPFFAMEILAEAKRLEAEGREVCHLEIGEPGQPVAPGVRKAVEAALSRPLGYTHAKGLPELRQRLAEHYLQNYGIEIDVERFIVTTGSSGGFLLAFLGAFDKGARIAVTRPGYPAYLNILSGLGIESVEIELHADRQWRLSAQDIKTAYAKQKFDGLLFASPANPTGAAVTRESFQEIIATCKNLGVRLISDEIYHGLEYAQKSASAVEFGDEAIVVNSFSKYYCMTGWRVGWMILPQDLVRRAETLQQNLFISAPNPSQIAALAALDEREYCETQKQQYARNRVLLRDGLEALGFICTGEGDGAFYVYVDISRFSSDSMKFCQDMLQSAGVAATPGADFDRTNGHKYVRFSFAGTEETIALALKKMAEFLAQPS